MSLAAVFPKNGLPFLLRSYKGFNNFCSSGQNILRKCTMPAKLLHPFTVVEGSVSELPPILLDESGTAENKVEVLFSHDKLLLTSILRPLHQVTEEMLV